MSDHFIHNSAIVEAAVIGEGTKIWAFVHILPKAVIGRNCNICDHCFVEDNVVIGDNVTIKSGVYLWNGVILEDNVFVGPNATFTNDLYPRSKNEMYIQKKTLVRMGASIGAGATVLSGVIIGKCALIGAGSVVTKDVDDFVLAYGNPAEKKGYICACGKRLVFNNFSAKCECGKQYSIRNDKVIQLL